METTNISLPERMKEYVDSQIAEGRYSSASEYVRDLPFLELTRNRDHSSEFRLSMGSAEQSHRMAATAVA